VKGPKISRVHQNMSQECKTVEAKQFLLRREDFKF